MAITTTRPTVQPEWASVDQNEPISGLPNKTAPTEELKLSGLLDNENLTRQHYNYLNDLYSNWINSLDAMNGVNTVYITTDVTVTPASLAALLGGTWVAQGTLAAAVTLYVFERTVL